MKYSICISTVMAVIDYMLENEWQFQNFPSKVLKITSEGFVLEKENDKCPIFISPSCLIEMLFQYLDKDTLVINEMIQEIPKHKLISSINYIELVNYLDKMTDTAHNINEEVIDLNYVRFKQMILSFKKYSSLSNQDIFKLKNENYESLVNLRTTKPLIARRLERMYQIETLLVGYCKKKIVQREEADVFDNDYVNYLEALDKIDLTEHTTSWDEFCKLIRISNQKEMAEQSEYWQLEQTNSNNSMLTVLGIPDICLPGYLVTYNKLHK